MEQMEQKLHQTTAPLKLTLQPHCDDLKPIGDYRFVSGKSVYKSYKSMVKWLAVRHRKECIIKQTTTAYILLDYGCHPKNGYYIEIQPYYVYDTSGVLLDTASCRRTVFICDAYKYGGSNDT